MRQNILMPSRRSLAGADAQQSPPITYNLFGGNREALRKKLQDRTQSS